MSEEKTELENLKEKKEQTIRKINDNLSLRAIIEAQEQSEQFGDD